MAFERIELNICPAGDMPVFHCSQYDVGRPIIIDLLNGDDAFTPTAGTTFELHCRKVDDNIVTLDTYEVDGNTLTFTSTEQLCACPGDNLCEVAIYLDELCMGTLNFMLHVEPDPLAGGLESESQIHDLYEQVEEITEQVIGDDYYNKTEVDDLLDDKADKATTYTKTEVDTALNLKADKSTTYTKTETNNLLAGKADANDTYSKAQVDSKLSLKADKATTYTKTETDTLLGYKANTSDVYTRSQTDSLLNNKADKLTTYTKTEVNNALALKANTADLATVATTGDYDDLINKPTIPDAQVQSDYAQTDNTKVDYIKNKPDLSIYVTEEELILTTGTENQTPYLLRDTPNGVCNKCLDMIVGGTVAFNQLVDGSFSDNSIWGVNNGSLSVSDGVGTITPNTGNVSLSMYLKSAHRPDSISGHKYLITFNAKVNNTLSKNFVWSCDDQTYNNVTLTDGVKKNVTTVISSSFTLFKPYFYPWGTAPNTFDGTERAYIDGFMIIDLTAFFGSSTIADYIYLLEQGTAGAGVAWFRNYFTADYYPYTANTLMSVKTSAKKIYDANNTLIETYDLSGSRLVHRRYEKRAYQDGDESLPDTITDGTNTVTKLTTPFDETVLNPELHGIPKLDTNNNLYYDGDTCSDFTNPQMVVPGGTEEYVDGRSIEIPVGHDTIYAKKTSYRYW